MAINSSFFSSYFSLRTRSWTRIWSNLGELNDDRAHTHMSISACWPNRTIIAARNGYLLSSNVGHFGRTQMMSYGQYNFEGVCCWHHLPLSLRLCGQIPLALLIEQMFKSLEAIFSLYFIFFVNRNCRLYAKLVFVCCSEDMPNSRATLHMIVD